MIKDINISYDWKSPNMTINDIMKLSRRSKFKPNYKFLKTVMR